MKKTSYCFCYQDENPPYAIGDEKIIIIIIIQCLWGVADCVEYVGKYPGQYTFRENGMTVTVQPGPIGYAAAGALVDLVF